MITPENLNLVVDQVERIYLEHFLQATQRRGMIPRVIQVRATPTAAFTIHMSMYQYQSSQTPVYNMYCSLVSANSTDKRRPTPPSTDVSQQESPGYLRPDSPGNHVHLYSEVLLVCCNSCGKAISNRSAIHPA